MMDINDKNIFNDIARGNKKSFEILFKAYYSPLVVYAQNYLENFEEAEEIVQELFYNLWNKRNIIEINQSIKAYLYNAVRNNCYDYLKHQKVKQQYAKHVANTGNSKDQDNSNELISKETSQLILDAIEDLPEKTRHIFKLNRFEGLKYREIAEKLDISPKTVENQMGIALKKLRVSLDSLINIKKS